MYLSGPISGLTYKGSTDWREFVTQAFPPHIQGVSPMRAKRYLDKPGVKIEGSYDFPMSTDRAINSRDRFDTLRADAVLVNLLGAERVSIGTVMEIAWAYDHKIPVVVAMEPEGNLHEHPMLRDSISVRVSSLEEAIEAVTAIVSPHEKHIWTRIDQVKMLSEENRLDVSQEPTNENYYGGSGRAN